MIELKNLTKNFDKLVAVNGINATIKEGTICGLAGSNGSGKSTMLRMLSGVYEPDKGEVLIDGENIFENTKVKSSCYYIADYPYFYNGATLNKLSAMLRKIYPNWDEEYYNRLCECFSINRKGKIINMSKGMQRQAALILAFATKPKYLFLDEIFDGLDPVIRQTLKKLIIENVTDNNMTAVIASHNLREFDDICDTIILIHNGDLVKNESVEVAKERSFRVQIAFNEDVTPEIFADMSTRNIVQKGRYFTLIINGKQEEINCKLREKNPAFVEILPLTLEEVFINEMGGAGYEVY